MADIYVYDAGSNTSPYDTAAKAATSLETAVSARGAGEKILMDYRHREDLSGGVTYTPGTSSKTDACILRSVDTADSDAYRLPTDHQIYMDAASSTSDIQFVNGSHWLIEGCWFETNDDMDINTADIKAYECHFMHPTGGNGSDMFNSSTQAALTAIGCTLNFPRYDTSNRNIRRWLGCTFENSGDTPAINSNGLFEFQGGAAEFVGCDLSAVGNANGLFDVDSQAFGTIKLIQCNLPASYVMTDSSMIAGCRIEGYGCAVDASDINADFVYEPGGDVLQDSAVYADAGFDDVIDGRFSHAMTPSSDCDRYLDLRSLFFGSVYTGGTGSKTFTVGCVHDFTSLDQSDVGLYLYYLGTSGSPAWSLELGLEIGGATTALASHSADWTGAAGKTKVNLTATATVNQTGWYAAQVVLRKYESGKKFWFDPVITVS